MGSQGQELCFWITCALDHLCMLSLAGNYFTKGKMVFMNILSVLGTGCSSRSVPGTAATVWESEDVLWAATGDTLPSDGHGILYQDGLG